MIFFRTFVAYMAVDSSKRHITIAIVGNPNSGKTTMYNALTGKSEKVGNWAGVTVDKKESPRF